MIDEKNNNNNCIICSSSNYSNLKNNIVKCNNCGHSFANLYLTKDQFTELYNKKYFVGDEYSNYLKDKKILQKNFNHRVIRLLKHIKNSKTKVLLEVGCAYGFFLEIAKKHFKEIVGVDISYEATQFAKKTYKFEVYNNDLSDWNFNNKTFDIACMWDTIEHLPNPEIYIKKITNNLSKNGVLALTTPDSGSIVAKFRKDKWRMIHPPTHLHYFSMKTITQLLEKNGYKIIYKKHCGFYRSIDNMFYNIFVLRLNFPFMYKLVKILKIQRLSIYLNLYDIMFIIAKKTN